MKCVAEVTEGGMEEEEDDPSDRWHKRGNKIANRNGSYYTR